MLTGLRGVGKTVLLDTFKPLAISHDWHWVGADLSESVSVSEDALAIRLLADLSVVSSSVEIGARRIVGFEQQESLTLGYETLVGIYTATPGLVADKLKATHFAERMFRVVMLDRLDESASREAILRQIDSSDCPVRFNEVSVAMITTAR